MKRTVTIAVDPTPRELANALAKMDADRQAEFFNALGKCDEDWNNGGWPMQLQWVTDSDALSPEGRWIMEMIGQYGPKYIGPENNHSEPENSAADRRDSDDEGQENES